MLRSGAHEYEAIKKGVATSYDRACDKYAELFGNELEKYPDDRELLEHFADSLPPRAKVCDMGCGPSAYIGSQLLPKSICVYGVDVSTASIQRARRLFPQMHLHVMDMMQTEFEDSFFDGLVSFYSIYHIPQKYLPAIFDEYSRIIKPGGRLLLVTHKGRFTRTLRELWGFQDLALYASFHLEGQVRRLLENSGFMIQRLEARDTVYPFPKQRIIALAEKK